MSKIEIENKIPHIFAIINHYWKFLQVDKTPRKVLKYYLYSPHNISYTEKEDNLKYAEW